MIARAKETFETERGLEIQNEWGIDEAYYAKIHVILGYPAGEIPKAKERKEDHIKIIV